MTLFSKVTKLMMFGKACSLFQSNKLLVNKEERGRRRREKTSKCLPIQFPLPSKANFSSDTTSLVDVQSWQTLSPNHLGIAVVSLTGREEELWGDGGTVRMLLCGRCCHSDAYLTQPFKEVIIQINPRMCSELSYWRKYTQITVFCFVLFCFFFIGEITYIWYVMKGWLSLQSFSFLKSASKYS